MKIPSLAWGVPFNSQQVQRAACRGHYELVAAMCGQVNLDKDESARIMRMVQKQQKGQWKVICWLLSRFASLKRLDEDMREMLKEMLALSAKVATKTKTKTKKHKEDKEEEDEEEESTASSPGGVAGYVQRRQWLELDGAPYHDDRFVLVDDVDDFW